MLKNSYKTPNIHFYHSFHANHSFRYDFHLLNHFAIGIWTNYINSSRCVRCSANEKSTYTRWIWVNGSTRRKKTEWKMCHDRFIQWSNVAAANWMECFSWVDSTEFGKIDYFSGFVCLTWIESEIVPLRVLL